MTKENRLVSALESYRVLDLTDEKGVLCTKILADLGADVIKVEKPGGDKMRNIGPFYHDDPHPEKSLYWFMHNTNKRSITLDIETSTGQAILKRLVKTADFLVECFPPSYLEKLGLGYAALSEINPRIVVTSITPFGQTGPYKDYKASDIVAMAMGGLMYLQGDADRAPLRYATSQAYVQTGAQAAAGTLIAHYYREATGEGQHVDVSMQECVSFAMDIAQSWWDLEKDIMQRLGSKRSYGNVVAEMLYESSDGIVCTLAGVMGGEGGKVLIQWMDSEGMAGDLAGKTALGMNMEAGTMRTQDMTQDYVDHRENLTKEFFKKHTSAELYEEAQARRIELTPLYSVKDILEDVQLKARDFFVPVDHPELCDTLVYPGAPFKMSRTPWRIRHRAPLIGEHNEEIYQGELGLSKDELILLKEGGVI